MADFNKIAEKWQHRWEKHKIFQVKVDAKKPKMYVLEMLPYPSGSGLHMGHVRNYAIGDAFARFKRMNGFNVIYPMGYDSFGLPAENAAIKEKAEPKAWTDNNMKIMEKQQRMLGLSYDWSRILWSHDPNYYKWNQWMFLQLYKKGLAYRKSSTVNWCPECNTVLANEQVVNGKCWRHVETDVDVKELEQWFYKITDYADELLEKIDELEHWPEKVKIMQKNWIGKSYGTEMFFDVVDEDGKKIDKISTFTTRPDTAFGITFMVFAIEHPKLIEYVKGTKYEKDVHEFIRGQKKRSLIERTAEGKEKFGVFIGKYFINPCDGKKYPLYAADYVLYEYGTGIVMGVPTHDQRDFEFAMKYNIPMKIVIQPTQFELTLEKMKKMGRAFVDEGVLVNSGEFDKMNNMEAIEEMSKWMEKQGFGKRTVHYKLRDWLISRQRYWGTPIPIIYCEKCGVVPVDEKDLPVELPLKHVDFSSGGNPLATVKDFVECKCPKCHNKARRETDTMDTFIDSSWYFIRYCSPKSKEIFNKKEVNYFMPVDQYIGGIEHAIMHLMYARFYTKALRDLGLLSFDEPFTRLLCQGMVIKDGKKMSKSFGNIVDPGEIIDKYGADTARLFMLFTALPEKELEWSEQGVNGCYRFLNRVFALAENLPTYTEKILTNKDKYLVSKQHETIKNVTELMNSFKFSLAIGRLMDFVNHIYKYKEKGAHKEVYEDAVKTVALLLAPFTPHIAEEVWEKLKKKGFVSEAEWPSFDEGKIDKEAQACEELVHNTISDINSVLELTKMKKPKKITLFVAAEWKHGFFKIVQEKLKQTREFKDIMKALNEKGLQGYGQEISKMLPRLLKDTGKLPHLVLEQKKEYATMINAIDFIKEEFKCEVEVVREERSKENKAKQALPGKVAIILQ